MSRFHQEAPVPDQLLPIGTWWANPDRKTWASNDHPSVVILEAGFQMEAYWGPEFVASYMRRMAEKFDERAKQFAAKQAA